MTTNYSLDQVSGLTQVLSDGTNTYLYGTGRLAQYNASGAEYFLDDALGSVRQLVDSSGTVSMSKIYRPFGDALSSAGVSASNYGFTGEWTDVTGLIQLRARYYEPQQGRFIQRDMWRGNDTKPMSYNIWLYVYGNPVNNIDPTGYIAANESFHADKIVKELAYTYGIKIIKDWGPLPVPIPAPSGVFDSDSSSDCGWNSGYWRSLEELRTVLEVVERYKDEFGSTGATRKAIGGVKIVRYPKWGTHAYRGAILIADKEFDQPRTNPTGASLQKEWGPKVAIAHELAHYWDWKTGDFLSRFFNLPGSIVSDMANAIEDEPEPTAYARKSLVEDWAESVAGYLFPVYFDWLRGDRNEWRILPNDVRLPPGLGPLHEAYVRQQFHQ